MTKQEEEDLELKIYIISKKIRMSMEVYVELAGSYKQEYLVPALLALFEDAIALCQEYKKVAIGTEQRWVSEKLSRYMQTVTLFKILERKSAEIYFDYV
jgi:hypothetical protein